jgi:hypothetical protein
MRQRTCRQRKSYGTTVMLLDPTRDSKNDDPYHKYFVGKNFGDDTYMLRDAMGANLRRVHVNHLKVLPLAVNRVEADESKVIPGAAAAPPNSVGIPADDGHVYYVDHVSGYCVRKGVKQYEVHWLGYNELPGLRQKTAMHALRVSIGNTLA